MEDLVKANVGEKVLFDKEIIGLVEKVSENAVIVQIIKNHTKREFDNNKTVISHRMYKIMAKN
ncbi:DUF2187 family protein [Fictibacillus enclensis]|uniref:DUF2187 family protein n=1 Tax=Fictibacillus enclensis TaxID=1017270 RepID=UPI0024BF2C03|nr:DUF2187 family protein [Fictibacillus enclensis]MDM5196619.1 DUF2187 family protein [Fictibacillus enclensis]MDM5335908.1 DUF2187 family protein [Fictibacillus enclensis]WHY71214.1 DUF2187 family protein [Fictibacillus enclensis]